MASPVSRRGLKKSWHEMPAAIPKAVADITAKIDAKPDQSIKIAAQTFLSTAQVRISDYRAASRELALCGRLRCSGEESV